MITTKHLTRLFGNILLHSHFNFSNDNGERSYSTITNTQLDSRDTISVSYIAKKRLFITIHLQPSDFFNRDVFLRKLNLDKSMRYSVILNICFASDHSFKMLGSKTYCIISQFGTPIIKAK